MKSLSCLSLAREHHPSSPTHGHQDSIDSEKENTETSILGRKCSKMHTIIDVLRCKTARPGRAAPTTGGNGIAPSKRGWTPLHYAVYQNREAALLHFLRAGHSTDGVTGSVESPLLVAVAAGHGDIVKILCAAGADVNTSTIETGETALHLAIKSGRTDIMEDLLARGPELDAPAFQSLATPLHYAVAKSGSLTAVVALLKHGANYEAVDCTGRTAAEMAISNSNINAAVAIVNLARGNRKKLAKEKDMLLRHVEKAQHRFSMNNDLIADIFEAGCDPDSTVLIEAIKRDDVQLAEMFLQKGADPNRKTAKGLCPIFAATASGAKMVQLLVKHNVDVTGLDSQGLTVLQFAFESPLVHDREAIYGIFAALVEAGADPKITYKDGKSLLHQAVSAPVQNPRIVQLVLECGVKANQVDNAGCGALHFASQSRSCLEVLLKGGADPTLKNNAGLTPLFSALVTASNDAEPDLEPLVRVSDLRLFNDDQKTALHIAAERGLVKITQCLLKHRAETTLSDASGRKPLLLAILNHRWLVVPLLATQPGINSWDKDGMTALHHVVTSMPQPPATWKQISAATAKFCERGVSRTMRNRAGQTPLIAAVMTLPEEGIPVIETLLMEGSSPRSNCIGHEDHQRHNPLFYAATLGKPVFVQTLLKYGAPFTLSDWALAQGPIQPTTPAHKRTLKLFAEHEWLRRVRMLHRISGNPSPDSEEAATVSALSKVLPVEDLNDLLSMGLDPNSLPVGTKRNGRGSLLWTILNQSLTQPPLPTRYLHDAIRLVLQFKADTNVITVNKSSVSYEGQDPKAVTTRTSNMSLNKALDSPLATRHAVTFLLEEHPTIDVDVITLLLNSGANTTTASPFYKGRYPLHSAVKAGRLDLVDEFLTRKSTANPLDEKKQTPIFIAAELGFWEIANLLIRFGADVSIKDIEGNAPIHAAIAGGSATIVSSLLRAGAKVLVKNDKGSLPSAGLPDIVDEREKSRISKLLKGAQQQEERDEELRKKKLEQQAIFEGQERRRKEREEAKRIASLTKQPLPPTSRLNTTRTASSSSLSVARKTSSPMLESPSSTSLISPPNTQKTRIDSGFGHRKPSPELEKSLPALNRTQKNFDSSDDKVEPSEELESWLALSKMMDRL